MHHGLGKRSDGHRSTRRSKRQNGLKADAEEGNSSHQRCKQGATVADRPAADPGVDADFMQRVKDAVPGVPEKEHDHRADEAFADEILRQRQDFLVAHRARREEKTHRHGDPGDEHQHRPEKGCHHAASTEKPPEDRGVGTFADFRVHAVIPQKTPKKARVQTMAEAQPPVTSISGASFLPPMTMGGMVSGKSLNQVKAW